MFLHGTGRLPSPFPAGRLALLIGGVLSAQAAQADSVYWSGPAGGNWFLDSNWVWDSHTPAATDTARIDSDGPLIQSGTTGNVATLQIGVVNTGILGVQGALNSATTLLGYNAGASGTGLVSPGQWRNSGGLYVGYAGLGSVTVNNGGSVQSDAAHLGAASGGTGTLLVDGSGSSLRLGAGRLDVGFNGTGTLTVRNGATVASGNATIGSNASGVGQATVSGADSTWTNTGNLYVGNAGNGALSIENGGTVTGVGGYVATVAGSTASLAVSGANSALNLSAAFIAGYEQGTRATVTVSDGGQIVGMQGTLGDLSGASGSMRISGTGSRWSAFVDNTVPYSGYMNVGRFGIGDLQIVDGGAVSGYRFYIGNEVASQGTVLLSGSGSLLQMDSNVYVGAEGKGTLTLRDGAQLRAAAVKVGYLAGAEGALNVGAASGQTAAAPGTIETRTIVLGAGDSRLVFNHTAADYALAADIVGSGRVTVLNGTTTLTGDSSYTGGTTISAGVLKIGNGGTSGSIVGDVANDGVLEFNRSDTLTYSGTIAGTGALVKSGAGTLILTGSNRYTGGTTIGAGTLQIGDGGTSGAIVGAIANNAKLVFNRSGSYEFPGTITGSGAVVIVGGATVNFTGASGYDGPITVAASSLALARGSLSKSSYTIGNGGVLSGSGTIAGLTVAAGGSVAPGYSPGTITVGGNVVFQPGAVYNVDVQSDQAHDLINATGTATIGGGTVAVHATPGGYRPSSIVPILQASGGVDGTFSTVSSDLGFLLPWLSYDANTVYLTMRRSDVSFLSQALTANQRAVAATADRLGWDNPVSSALANLAVTAAPAAFDRLSGEAYATASGIMLRQSRYVRDIASARFEQEITARPTFWVQGFGTHAGTRGDGNAATAHDAVAGMFGGAVVQLGESGRAGVLAGYGRTSLDVAARGSSGAIKHYDVGVYAGTRYGEFAFKAGAGYTWHAVGMDRTVAFAGYDAVNTSDYDAATAQVFGEAAYTWQRGGTSLEPFVGLAQVHVSASDPTETGSSSALVVATRPMNALFSSAGVRLGGDTALAPGVVVRPRFSVGWMHAFGDNTPTAQMALLGGSPSFGVSGLPIVRDSLLIGADVAYRPATNTTLSLRYSGQFGAGLRSNTLDAVFAVRF